MKIELSKYERAIYYEIFNSREYWILDEIIKKSEIIFDIWGHIWLWSLYILQIKSLLDSKLFWDELEILETWNKIPDYNIHFFEPLNENYLKSEQILNNFKDSIILNKFWFSKKEEFSDIFKWKISSQSSKYKSFLNRWENPESCKFKKLENYISENNIESVDLMKMDIEWAEFEVLLNLDEKYFKKIKTLFFEYHILNNEFEFKFGQLKIILKHYYSNIEIIESKYDSRIGYILAK